MLLCSETFKLASSFFSKMCQQIVWSFVEGVADMSTGIKINSEPRIENLLFSSSGTFWKRKKELFSLPTFHFQVGIPNVWLLMEGKNKRVS